MVKSSVKCPNCDKMVWSTVNGFCINCRPDLIKSLKEINKEYAKLNKKKKANKK